MIEKIPTSRRASPNLRPGAWMACGFTSSLAVFTSGRYVDDNERLVQSHPVYD